MAYALPPVRQLFGDAETPREMAERKEELVQEMTKATIAGLTGETTWGPKDPNFMDSPIGGVVNKPSRSARVEKAYGDYELAKSVEAQPTAWDNLQKEWTLSNPVTTGLVPYDLEAPAKLLTPRPTPIRNSTPRIKGQGGARRFKVISGFTGTGTGGATTVQPGINESSTNAGPGGLSYIRGPYINYDGYDVTLNYVTTSLSDSVSWQAQFGSAA